MLRPGVHRYGGEWADLGSGDGAFTLALAELLGPGGTIYSVDKIRASLEDQAVLVRHRYPDVHLITQRANFQKSLDVPPLDGIVMANSLHFVRQKLPLVVSLRKLLKPGGRLLLVEYNLDRGNLWVPHPVSFEGWCRLAAEAGFADTVQIGARPSRFLREIYSAYSA